MGIEAQSFEKNHEQSHHGPVYSEGISSQVLITMANVATKQKGCATVPSPMTEAVG